MESNFLIYSSELIHVKLPSLAYTVCILESEVFLNKVKVKFFNNINEYIKNKSVLSILSSFEVSPKLI